MHTFLIVAVEAESAEDAAAEASAWVEDRAGAQGTLCDWFDVGGRWATLLAGGSTLGFGANPVQFLERVAHAVALHRASYDALRWEVTGEPTEMPHFSNERPPPPASDGAVETRSRLSDSNARTAALIREVLSSPEQLYDFGHAAAMLRLVRFSRMAADQCTADSFFWDTVEGTSEPDWVVKRCSSPEGRRQWLVVLDLHM